MTYALTSLTDTGYEAQAITRAILTRQRLDYNKHVPSTNKFPDAFIHPGLIRFGRIGDTSAGYLQHSIYGFG